MRLAIVGDICPDSDLRAWRDAEVPELHRELGVDLVVGNFEATIDGHVVGDLDFAPQKIRLSVPGEGLARLLHMGVDVVGVANNHLWDYGRAAAEHTVSRLAAVFGHNRVFGWREQPAVELLPGLRILGACFSETNPQAGDGPFGVNVFDNAASAVSAVAIPRETLITFVHWGEEHARLADGLLRGRARSMIEAGASHVVGSHSHAEGAGERVGDSVVLYSLGNFLFRMIPTGSAKMLRADRRGLVAVFRWENRVLTYEECWRSEFDNRMNLRLRRLGRDLPGGQVARAHMHLPTRGARGFCARGLCRAERSTSWARRGLARVLTGVEAPSWRKIRTAGRLLSGRGTRETTGS
jgi:hypothetical protein